jgi:hypothetical protein
MDQVAFVVVACLLMRRMQSQERQIKIEDHSRCRDVYFFWSSGEKERVPRGEASNGQTFAWRAWNPNKKILDESPVNPTMT